jgi:hypothetical protein
LLMKDSSSSETEIWKGLGSDTSGFVVDAMVEYSRLSLSRVTKFELANWLMKEMEGLAIDKESSRREGETRLRLTINFERRGELHLHPSNHLRDPPDSTSLFRPGAHV